MIEFGVKGLIGRVAVEIGSQQTRVTRVWLGGGAAKQSRSRYALIQIIAILQAMRGGAEIVYFNHIIRTQGMFDRQVPLVYVRDITPAGFNRNAVVPVGRDAAVEFRYCRERRRRRYVLSQNILWLSIEQLEGRIEGGQPSGNCLVAAINDLGALGAIAPLEEVNRAAECAVSGQNATLAAHIEMRKRNSPLIGSVAYHPSAMEST